jgi:hypothetical protein
LDEYVISNLQEVVVSKNNDSFYGVSAEAANTLGSYNDRSDHDNSDKAYQALKMCFNKQTLSGLVPQVRRAVVASIGGFVRMPDENSLNIIREWISEWVEKPPTIDVKMRKEKEEKEPKTVGIKGKIDNEEKLEVIRLLVGHSIKAIMQVST